MFCLLPSIPSIVSFYLYVFILIVEKSTTKMMSSYMEAMKMTAIKVSIFRLYKRFVSFLDPLSLKYCVDMNIETKDKNKTVMLHKIKTIAIKFSLKTV